MIVRLGGTESDGWVNSEFKLKGWWNRTELSIYQEGHGFHGEGGTYGEIHSHLQSCTNLIRQCTSAS